MELVWHTVSLVVLLLAAAAAATADTGAIDIGSRLQLFTDDYLIGEARGVELRLNHPVRCETAITFDAPWEGDTCAYVSIFKDGDIYRMYYRGSNENPKPAHAEVTAMAESKDGIVWTRPKLGIHEFGGSKDNNIVWMSPGSHAFTPFLDSNPKATVAEKFKAITIMRPGQDRNTPYALFAFTSADGIHWKPMREEPIITDGLFDSQNLAFWDTERGEYVSYYRDWKNDIRTIKRASSKDFQKWTPGEDVVYTGAPAEDLYTNAITPYFRSPGIYLGFPKRFVPARKAVAEHPVVGVSDGVFMSSRDGLNFRLFNEAFIRPGNDKENWTDRNIMTAWGLLNLKPAELSLFYSEHYRHPTNRLVRATIRTDGFTSLHAGGERGQLVTKPVTFSGREMLLNYATSAIGGIRVELQDAEGKPIKGFALDDCPVIYGDEIEHVVKWRSGSSVADQAGKPVKLVFEMLDADLYSIKFRP